jgi:hypothetical protein
VTRIYEVELDVYRYDETADEDTLAARSTINVVTDGDAVDALTTAQNWAVEREAGSDFYSLASRARLLGTAEARA